MMEKSKPNDLLTDLENQHLRQRSGNVTSDSNLVEFLYLLMRDHATPGVVEELVRITRKGGSDTLFSNGWLARYAEDVAQRLLEAKPK